MQRRLCLDKQWRFHQGDIVVPLDASPPAVKVGLARGAASPDAPDRAWRAVDLPHDWGIENDPVPWGQNYQGYCEGDVGWYRKYVRLPEDVLNRKVFLEFEGITRNATVYVNGFRLGDHRSGYTPFWCDITDCVPRYLFQEADDPRPDGRPEVIAVRVDAREPEGWWYEGCGIYRHVWLHIWDRVHFAPYGVWWSTPEIGDDRAMARVHAAVENEEEAERTCTLRLRISDGEAVVAETSETLNLSLGRNEHEATMEIPEPRRWSPEDPHLYTIHAELERDGETVHRIETPLGLRTFRFDADEGFFLNGRPYTIKGVNAHQDFAGVGVALPDRLHEKRVELFKGMGCNAFRCGHNPPAPAFLDACDRLGLLVLDENRKLAVAHEDLADLERMVLRDRAHPSVFAWDVCNEEFATTRPLAARVLATNRRIVEGLDPQRRPVFFSCNLWANPALGACAHSACVDAVDVVGVNYALKEYDALHAKFPGRVLIPTEYQALNRTRGVYEKHPHYPFLTHIAEPLPPADHEYGRIKPTTLKGVLRGWRIIHERPYIGGGFLWIGMDHRGEIMAREARWPTVIRTNAPIDYCGFPKDIYSFFKACWNKNVPLVHLFPHWTWPERKEETVYIRAFSNCDEVEIFVNGDSQGRQPVPTDDVLEWAVTYHPGEVRAVGYRNGAKACEDRVRTAWAPAALALEPDRTRIAADGADLSCMTIRLLDTNGTPVPDDDRMVTVAVEGPGRLLGMGNGDPTDHTLDASPTRTTFKGLALALVQSTGEEGTVRVHVEGDRVSTAEATIEACME